MDPTAAFLLGVIVGFVLTVAGVGALAIYVRNTRSKE